MDFELTKEQRDFQRIVHDFVAQEVRPLAKHVDETGEFNWQAVKKMGPLGMLGLQVPEEYGGAELDTVCATIAVEELGWACGSTALAVSAHNCLGQGPLADRRERLARRTRNLHRRITFRVFITNPSEARLLW